jgi:NAD(P)-dependent dehydrogenase (short-subunit alcohol dehydrogenase family)
MKKANALPWDAARGKAAAMSKAAAGAMRGRVCLVTGGSSGVGRATALGLAGLGAIVLLVSRDPWRGERAAGEIRRCTGNPEVRFLACDLSLQREVRRLAREVAERHPVLHVLANCAGHLALRRELTEEGIERTLAVDYLSHFLLTLQLLEPLRAGAPSRVITVAGSPGTLRRLRLRADFLQPGARLSGVGSALQAALARALFSFELSRRLRGSGVAANAFHPGLVRTRLDRNLPWPLRLPVRLASPLLRAGCPTAVQLACARALAGASGLLFARGRPVALHPHDGDLDAARRLWDASERLTGTRLP